MSERIRYDLDPNSSDTAVCDDVLHCSVCGDEIGYHGDPCACEDE